jgi:hypothetical protein
VEILAAPVTVAVVRVGAAAERGGGGEMKPRVLGARRKNPETSPEQFSSLVEKKG